MTKKKKAKNKRIFLVGKTRELDPNNQQTFEDEVKADVKKDTGRDFGFKVVSADDKEITMNFPITVSYDVESGLLPDACSWLIMGKDAEIPFPTMGFFSSWGNLSVDKRDIEEAYKRNARYYKASSLRNVDISYNPTSGLALTLEFR